MKNIKKINIENLEIGEEYIVICKIWRVRAKYVGTTQRGNKCMYIFTTGDKIEDWEKSWNIVSTKSNLKIYDKRGDISC